MIGMISHVVRDQMWNPRGVLIVDAERPEDLLVVLPAEIDHELQRIRAFRPETVKDAVGIAEQGKFLFPLLGEGRVDWAGFFRALDDLGYEGFMSVEFESFEYYRTVLKGDVEQAARMSMMQIEELMKSAE